MPRLHELDLAVPDQMNARYERIARVQAGMREQGLIAIVVMNHDDYRYLFGEDRTQPRALIPFQGPFPPPVPRRRTPISARRYASGRWA